MAGENRSVAALFEQSTMTMHTDSYVALTTTPTTTTTTTPTTTTTTVTATTTKTPTHVPKISKCYQKNMT